MKSTMFLAALVLLAASPAAAAETFSARVERVSDGDSLIVVRAGERVRVRLGGVDAPELDQPYGRSARAELGALVGGRTVEVTVLGADRYGRVVGRVRAAGRDVNREMVARGAAWVHRGRTRGLGLGSVEDQARRARRGLWALPEARRVSPGEWRRAD